MVEYEYRKVAIDDDENIDIPDSAIGVKFESKKGSINDLKRTVVVEWLEPVETQPKDMLQ